MDIKKIFLDIVDKIKTFSQTTIEKLTGFYEENKKLSIVIIGLIISILILLLLVLSLAGKSKNQKGAEKEKVLYTLTEPLLVPNGPEIEESYTITRDKKEKWSEEEVKQWFTIPSEKDIESLKKTNDRLISDILGAAP
ncbi:MAG: hypothetical protein MJ188_09345 [Treponema sp.]|nr:hypothetical protein [Treponema sp.]